MITSEDSSEDFEGPDPFETSVQLFKGAKDFAPKHKRDTFVQGIAMLEEHGLQSGKISPRARCQRPSSCSPARRRPSSSWIGRCRGARFLSTFSDS